MVRALNPLDTHGIESYEKQHNTETAAFEANPSLDRHLACRFYRLPHDRMGRRRSLRRNHQLSYLIGLSDNWVGYGFGGPSAAGSPPAARLLCFP